MPSQGRRDRRAPPRQQQVTVADMRAPRSQVQCWTQMRDCVQLVCKELNEKLAAEHTPVLRPLMHAQGRAAAVTMRTSDAAVSMLSAVGERAPIAAAPAGIARTHAVASARSHSSSSSSTSSSTAAAAMRHQGRQRCGDWRQRQRRRRQRHRHWPQQQAHTQP